MEKRNNKLIQVLKKHYVNLLIFGFALTILIVPEAKVLLQQGLMKVGLFQPSIEKVEPKINSTNSNFTLINHSGEAVQMQELKGKIVFVNFWATWCPPCLAEMPTIQTLAENFKNDDRYVFLLVEVESNNPKAQNILDKRNIDLPLYFPYTNIPDNLYKGTLPTTIIFDKEGNLVFQEAGMANYASSKMITFMHELSQ